MTLGPRSPIKWFGGKGRLRRWIVDLLPPHKHYVEPFGGGASVLLAKEPCVGNETYNDLDSALVDFFRVLTDPEQFTTFMRRVEALPVSRELYNEYRATWSGCDGIERAARWFVVARQSFAGRFGHGGFGTQTSSRRGGSSGACWMSCIKRLPEIHARLQGVQIEHADFRDVFKRYDGPGYLAYCDPPYVANTRRSGKYTHEMSDEDHNDLVRLLLAYQGAVVLSGYNSGLYASLETKGWVRHDRAVPCHAAGRTKATGLQGVGVLAKNQRRTESVWQNPEARRRIEEAECSLL